PFSLSEQKANLLCFENAYLPHQTRPPESLPERSVRAMPTLQPDLPPRLFRQRMELGQGLAESRRQSSPRPPQAPPPTALTPNGPPSHPPHSAPPGSSPGRDK